MMIMMTMMMNIKKLMIAMVFVVGFAPNNIRAECPCVQAELVDENDESWQIIDEQENAGNSEPLIDFVRNYRSKGQCEPLPSYQSRPANVSFHKQMEPCSVYEEDPLASHNGLQLEDEEDQSYVVIYKVK